jgi:hypothetical protein
VVMLHKTEAASSSCTCWCLEIRSLDVTAQAGSCSHLLHQDQYLQTEQQGLAYMCLVRQLLCL